MKKFLRTFKTDIHDQGRPVILKGVNLGGWLLMEAYILHAPNIAEQIFKKNFQKKLGAKALREFERDFRDHFITREDFCNIARMGFNCLRVPFNSRLIEKSPYRYDASGVAYLDQVVRWAREYKLWVILDLHAACGAQNHDWHSDSLGKADLWHNKKYQHRTFALWEFLADRYKDEPAVAGYDLLNEAVIADHRKLNAFYHQLIKTVRGVDRNHILFVEGNRWAQDLDVLDDFSDDNLALSAHFYVPIEYVFNMIPHLAYPLKEFGRSQIDRIMAKYHALARRKNRPVFVGEFGINARQGLYGEDRWLKDVLDVFKRYRFHWTYWTYKAVKNGLFPDGVFSYFPNDPWINRHGPIEGWDTYALHWTAKKKDMVSSWETPSFQANPEIVRVLKRAAKTK